MNLIASQGDKNQVVPGSEVCQPPERRSAFCLWTERRALSQKSEGEWAVWVSLCLPLLPAELQTLRVLGKIGETEGSMVGYADIQSQKMV
jgi:hypothetical protein